MSERAERAAMARGGVLLRRDPARDIEELRAFEAEREVEHWERLRRTLRGPVMAGRNLGDMAANTDPGITDALQAGVVSSGDLAQSAITVAGANGAIGVTVAAGVAWVPDANGLLRRVSLVQQAPAPAFPWTGVNGLYFVAGLEMDSAGAFSWVKGVDTATVLNTGALIAANTKAVTAARIRILDVALHNPGGAWNFGDNTAVATKGVNWIDRRPWARGASYRYSRTAANYSISSAVAALIDAANMSPRVECSGVPLSVRLEHATFQHPGGAELDVYLNVDGAQSGRMIHTLPVGYSSARVSFDFTPAAGSHLLQILWSVAAGTVTLYGQAGGPSVSMVVEEIVRQNASNGAQ